MTSDSDLVARKIRELFSDDDAELVTMRLESLDLPGRILPDRLRLAILKLCHGDIARLDALAKLAEVDPRDVIGEAEYPRQMRYPPGMATEDLILADRAEYEAWLDAAPPDNHPR